MAGYNMYFFEFMHV